MVNSWLIVGVSALFPSADDPKPFTYSFQPGDERKYISRNTRTIRYKAAGKTVEVSVETASANLWKVHAVSSDGVADVGQTITRLKITQKGGPKKMQTIDSAAEDTPEAIKPVFEALTESEIRFKMKPNGEVGDVTLPLKLKEVLGTKEAGKAPILTEEGLVGSIRNSTFILPKKALKPDDGWDLPPHTYQEAGHWITMESRITFDGTVNQDGRRLLKFVRTPTYTIKKSDEPNEFAAATIKNQGGQATILLDADTRRLVEHSSTESIVYETGEGAKKVEVETTIVNSNKLKEPERQDKKTP